MLSSRTGLTFLGLATFFAFFGSSSVGVAAADDEAEVEKLARRAELLDGDWRALAQGRGDREERLRGTEQVDRGLGARWV